MTHSCWLWAVPSPGCVCVCGCLSLHRRVSERVWERERDRTKMPRNHQFMKKCNVYWVTLFLALPGFPLREVRLPLCLRVAVGLCAAAEWASVSRDTRHCTGILFAVARHADSQIRTGPPFSGYGAGLPANPTLPYGRGDSGPAGFAIPTPRGKSTFVSSSRRVACTVQTHADTHTCSG